MIGYYSEEELKGLGFGACGKNVRISKTSTIYNRPNVYLGDNIRIDNFCVLAISGQSQLRIGSHVQISAYSFINGMGSVTLEDFVTFAPYVRLFSSSDDYSGDTLTNATISPQFLGTVTGDILLRRHSILGTGTTIMPGVTLAEGTAVAAHSFVNKDSEAFTMIGGVPARFIKKRNDGLLKLEGEFLREYGKNEETEP